MVFSGTIERSFRHIFEQRSPYNRHTRWRAVARVQHASKAAQFRLEWMIHYETAGHNALFTSRHFGVAPKTFWKWRKRFDETNPLSLEEKSRAPKTCRLPEITPLQEERLVNLRKRYLRYGKEKLALKYALLYQEKISSWKAQRIIQKYQLYYHPNKSYRTQQKRLRATKKKRITELTIRKQAGFLFRLDSVVRYWEGTKRYILTAVDTISRLGFAHMYTNHSSAMAADFLHRLHHLTNGQIQNIQTDNGSEFHKEFDRACQNLAISHYWSRVRTPKDNSYNERFNRTLEEEFIQLGNRITDPVEFNQKLTEWLIEYNFFRPHQSLGYLAPMCLIQNKKELLPMWPSSTSPWGCPWFMVSCIS